jgi:hypothetical protein
MMERIAEALQDPAIDLGATVEQVACSDAACAIEFTYAFDPTDNERQLDVEQRMRSLLTAETWFQSEIVLDPTKLEDAPASIAYPAFTATPPTMDVIWAWHRKRTETQTTEQSTGAR